MKDEKEKALAKESERQERLKAEQSRLLAKDIAMTKAYRDREQVIEQEQKAKEDQRAKDRAEEEIRELAKEKARKEAYQAREKIIAEQLEARKKLK